MTTENPAGLRETIHEATAAYCDHVIQPPQCQRIAMRVRELLAAAEPGLDEAWAETEAALPLTGWPDRDGKWVLPGSGRRITLRWFESGDGYSEPHEEGWIATATLYGFGGPDRHLEGDAAVSPALALRALAARLANESGR